MKIAVVVHDLKGGGAEKMMVRLANGLANLGDQVNLVLLTGGGVNKEYVAANVELTELNSPRTALSLTNLRKHLKATQPDKIISALTHVNVIAILACLSLGIIKKLFVSERNAFSLDKYVSDETLIKVAYAVAPWLYRAIPNPVIAVSKGVAQDLVDTTVVNSKSVSSAPNPVLDDDFESKNYGEPLHPWLKDKKVPTIVAAGRLAPQKGFDILLDAFAQVKKQLDARLVIFGDGPLRDPLQAQIDALGLNESVQMPGYVKAPLNEMAASDLFVLSSRFEGSPNVLVEAMSTGVSVVAANCPHGPDEILLSGDIGYLADTESVESLARNIILAFSERGDTSPLVKRANRYTVSNAAKHYREILTFSGKN